MKKLPPEASPVQADQTRKLLPRKSSRVPWPIILQGLVIAAATLWIYQPALHGGWLWDDDSDITGNSIIQSPTGLWSIWFEPGRQYEYYPIKSTLQWLQWQLWGMDTLGYHLTNVVLHVLSALLVWRLLSKFGLRLAWLGGLIFAVHPAQVESVAWIAELKNTLSLPPFLLAMSAYLDYQKHGKSKDYFLALGLFLVSLLCKLTTVLFPLAILLYVWSRRGRIGWNDLKISLPFFGVSLLLGMVTIGTGIWDHRFDHPDPGDMPVGGFAARLIVAGLSLSFCFSKVILPLGLLPIYPKWTVDPASPVQYLPWLVLGAVIGWLWTKRQGWGRPALLGFGFFLINLAPCPGFIPAPDMAYTWVMDHFLYLPIIGLIGLAVAALEQVENQLPLSFRPCVIGVAIVVSALLVFQSHSYAKMFIDEKTLWTYELRHNPKAYPAHNNLGLIFFNSGQMSKAEEQFEEALRIKPDDPESLNNLGNVLFHTNRVPEAIRQYELSLQSAPTFIANYNLGGALLQSGQLHGAIEHFQRASQLRPDVAEAHYYLAYALQRTGRLTEAMDQYKQALRIRPDYVSAQDNLASLQAMQENAPPKQ